jgi:cysteine desulfurase
MDTRIYFDNNATTPIAPEVLEAMLPYYTRDFGNPSSVHWFGQQAKKALDQAREQVSALIGAEPNEIVFVGSGTESDNLALQGIVLASPRPVKHLITSNIEHHAILHTSKALEKNGVRATYVGANSRGLINPDEIEAAITPETILISIMLANNETGTLQPLSEIGKIARHHDICFHTDAVQAVGKIPVNVENLCLDLLSISGHKIHAPKGVGALYVRKGTRLSPIIHGGGHERSRRAGTENIPQIAGLGKACEMAGILLEQTSQSIRQLRDYFETEVLRRIPEVEMNGDAEKRLPNTSNLRFTEVEGEGMLINLDLAGIACSTGSACTSGSIDPSHVLSAMGIPREKAFGSIRFSFSRYNTLEEVDHALNLLPGIVERMQALSPFRKK